MFKMLDRLEGLGIIKHNSNTYTLTNDILNRHELPYSLYIFIELEANLTKY